MEEIDSKEPGQRAIEHLLGPGVANEQHRSVQHYR
jgi:hypothetical protein